MAACTDARELLLLLLLFLPCLLCDDCPSRLLWNRKVFLGSRDGYQMDVCCNVSYVWAAKLLHGWRLQLPADLDDRPVAELGNAFANEMIVSVCPGDDEPVFGFVQSRNGRPCTQHSGRTIRLSAAAVDMDAWYVVCFKDRTKRCTYCSFELFCSNLYTRQCADVWLQRSVSRVRNDSMVLWVATGARLPFAEGALRVSVHDQRQPATEKVAGWQRSLLRNSTVDFAVEHLQPDTWYRVRTCVAVVPPTRFASTYGLPGGQQLVCMQEESWRTTGPTGAAARREQICSVVITLLVLLIFTLLWLQ